FKLPDNPTAADTLEGYKKAMEVRAALTHKNKKKRLTFEQAARKYSDDPTVGENGGVLGWVSVFRYLYPLECAAYNTPVGEISMPIRTHFGYHLVKVMERTPSVGDVLTAHIMLFTSRDNDSINQRAAFLADSLSQRLKAGEDFVNLVRNYSQDRGSTMRDGQLPWFGRGEMASPEYEDVAFALKTGEVSEPFRSAYGWHIVQLQDKRGVRPLEEIRDELERNVERDNRGRKVATSFINKLKAKYAYVAQEENWQSIYKYATGTEMDNSVFLDSVAQLSTTLFTIGGKPYTAKDWSQYLKTHTRKVSQSIPEEAVKERIADYVKDELMTMADADLVNEHVEFRNLLNEYHDGILLFEVSNREVWERASKDEEGMKKYFENHRTSYAWAEPHYKGSVIYCKDKATWKAAKAITKHTETDSLETYLTRRLNDSIQYVRIEQGLYVKGDNPAVDKQIFKTGNYKPSGEYPYVIVKGYLQKELPDDYKDVKGILTSDYQQYLEKEWIKHLRKNYPVVVNERVFEAVKQRIKQH
ncbi:MAG: peptidylprolyl isomerase, partial [Paludibacteraceae bacterium]|nr:peptidylprolyl isomerase [Paludibacteraceae bacterium]